MYVYVLFCTPTKYQVSSTCILERIQIHVYVLFCTPTNVLLLHTSCCIRAFLHVYKIYYNHEYVYFCVYTNL